MVRDWRSAKLATAERALCAFAEKLTHRPREMSPSDLDELRAIGFDDRALHDAVQVVAYFNYITRVADGLGLQPEEFLTAWGEEG